MKKIIALLLALSVIGCLCACGNSGDQKETTAPSESNQNAQSTAPVTEPATEPAVESGSDDYVFSHNGVDIVMNAPAADIIAALGEPKSYSEETSCAFDGLDKTWFFGSFYVQTYPMNGEDFVYCLWIVDDSVETPEGIYIGADQADVEAAYGTDAFNGTNAWVITGENTRLTIILEGGVVSSIQYDAVI